MASKFIVHHVPSKGYHFTLIAINGKVIATSEHYQTHRACIGGIESVRRNATNATIEDPTLKPAAVVKV